jgi:hypothetical protein
MQALVFPYLGEVVCLSGFLMLKMEVESIMLMCGHLFADYPNAPRMVSSPPKGSGV